MPTKAENAEIARQIMPNTEPEVLEGGCQPPEGIFVLAWTPEDSEPLFQGSRWTKMLSIDENDIIRLYVSYFRETNKGAGHWHEAPTCVAEIAGYLRNSEVPGNRLRCIGGLSKP